MISRNYIPSNLTAAIIGDVQAEEVFKMARLYFGRIPSGPKFNPIRTKESKQWVERRVTVDAKSQPLLIIGYHRPSCRHNDDSALETKAVEIIFKKFKFNIKIEKYFFKGESEW
jgi:predicted Zn-dependent peptidase